MTRKILLSINTTWNAHNFRAGLIRALVASGYEVVIATPSDEYVARVEAMGCRHVHLPMDKNGTNPVHDLGLLGRYIALMKAERPDVFLGFTAKPNVYGSLAAQLLRVPVVNNVAGLGAVFARDGVLQRVVQMLYRVSLRNSACVFFQNSDDQEQFIARRIVRRTIVDRLPGSGVDLERFRYSAQSPGATTKDRPMRFLMVARMLWDKGVGEFVEAARTVKTRHPEAEFCILGSIEEGRSASVSCRQMLDWIAEGTVKYLGASDDVRAYLATADSVVLPSYYREGVPRSLLEAAAMARPIITTDAIGCREAVEHKKNGYLVAPRDAEDLAEKMMLMISVGAKARARMGKYGRQKVSANFDEKIVIRKYLNVIERVTSVKAGYAQDVEDALEIA